MVPYLWYLKLNPGCLPSSLWLWRGAEGLKGFRAWGLKGLGFKGLGFKGFRVWGLGFKGLGFRV